MPDGIVTLRGRLAWAHDFNPDRAIGATFQALQGASFVVNGTAMAADSALVTAAAEKRWLNVCGGHVRGRILERHALIRGPRCGSIPVVISVLRSARSRRLSRPQIAAERGEGGA
jgi:hypothetical protein